MNLLILMKSKSSYQDIDEILDVKESTEIKHEIKNKVLDKLLPVFELYQYNIVNYSTSSKRSKMQFDNINESKQDCETFAVQYKKENKHKETFSVCDIITDAEPSIVDKYIKLTIENIYSEFYKYLYYIHKILKPKYFTHRNMNDYPRETIIDIDIINKLLDQIIPKYDKQCIEIFNINTLDDKFIIMGDFHGSLHSFIRILFRLHKYKVLDITTMKLYDNYYLVFLGDIVDRGMFSIEILTTILLLINNNPDKIKFIAGNHEASSPNINSHYGFEKENIYKYESEQLYMKFNLLFSILPVAIIVHDKFNKQAIWLSHGCFNANYNYNLPLNYDENSKVYLTSDMANSILWSDIDYTPGISRDVHDHFYNNNKFEEFMEFMRTHNIKGVIRGHQDNLSNSIIYHNANDNDNADDNVKYLAFNDHINRNKCNESQICFNKFIPEHERSKGPIARIIVSMDSYEESAFKPIITISTATDIGKKLIADSFGLLRFDIKDNISDFSSALKNSVTLPGRN
jgi:hypothetical protein